MKKISFLSSIYRLLIISLCLLWNAAPAKADVIYHAFDECFANIKAELPRIKEAGYTHIQISPPNKTPSREDDPCTSDEYWYIQYQPFDYVLEGNLGSEKELKELIEVAHDRGIKVIVDVVFNHMANYRYYRDVAAFPEAYPLYPKQEYFHEPRCIANYQDPNQVENYWLCTNNDPEGLPDLRTELPDVQQKQQEYLKKLLGLGVDGFRFDAAKHISVEDLEQLVQIIPEDKFYYGEVIGQTFDESMKYVPTFPKVTDFQLVNTLKSAFSFGGDLRSLINPRDTERALPGEQAVTFARNHDTWAARQFENWKFSDRDLPLATAYILARKEGLPLILKFDAFHPTVVAGTQFHEKMLGESQYYRNGNEIAASADNPNLLFIERGDRGLAIINKAGETVNVTVAKMPGLGVGCYQELQYDFQMCIDYGADGQKYINKWGSRDRGGIEIGRRTALFFAKIEAD
ncbi:MAG: alpha-amylase family glycosyl hydrolase [Oscillatoria sp. PMC 1068.18]|nr:alpha-amylase family glycosyl hydrolase [Oscillatoria sp. PMC 1076.18]MEC4988014.1 alpha-amylase family glycosyl hydrolase [Oscillatoria sp. PMC 1068.18]